MQTPVFWKTDLETISNMASSVRRAQVKELCRTPGGRPLTAFCYGQARPVECLANYSSACGAGDRDCYSSRADKTPTVVLLGAVHGGETEGTAALLNLISLMECGRDLAGAENHTIIDAAQGVRLIIVPVCNPDGRARVQPDTMVGLTGNELRYWMQGTWKDGSLCGWPDCKKRHPIKEHVGFLGGYYNDDGINLMHDNFFHPMATETQAILDLCDSECADWVLHMHGGSNSVNDLLQPSYVPVEVNEAVRTLAQRCDAVAKGEGLKFTVRDLPQKEHGDTPPSFNLVSAVHHVCGAVSACFESNECIIDQPGEHFTHEQIYRSHMILFEQCLRTARGILVQ